DELVVIETGPRPDVGDRDVVFLRGNGRSICPLVGCGKGRLRLVGESVYDEEGRAFALRPDGAVRLGKTSESPAFARWEAAGIGRVRGGIGDADVATGVEPPAGEEPAAAMPADALRTVLEKRVAALHSPAELAALRPVKSLDP